ncbi:chemotaxis protein CheX [Lachnospiraceae bacterium ZAX-1]
MYTQFFGNYLVSRGVIPPNRLAELLKIQAESHIKIGVLAVHAGYMTGGEVEHVFIMQTHKNLRFGELAIKEGYLTPEQVKALLASQTPDFLLLGQILVEQHIVSSTELQNLMTDYQSDYELCDLDELDEQKEMVKRLIQNFYHFENIVHADKVANYLNLFFNTLVRFIGAEFTPLNIISLQEIPTNYCVLQMINGPLHMLTALDMEPQTAIGFASLYVSEEFDQFDEYVKASLEDFLNLLNGLFSVSMSNEYSTELGLEPLIVYENTILSAEKLAYMIPIVFSFGTIYFILSNLTD